MKIPLNQVTPTDTHSHVNIESVIALHSAQNGEDDI